MRKGFTLLEMIVVIAVISLLFLLTIPNIQKVMSIIRKKGCDAQLKIVDTAILEYSIEFDVTPDSMDQLVQEGFLSEEQVKCETNEEIIIEDGQAKIS